MTAPDDVRARFEAWCQQGGWNVHNPNLLKAFEGGYRAAHADLSGEVRDFLDAQPLTAKNDARRVWQILEDAGVDTAALAKFTHQEKP